MKQNFSNHAAVLLTAILFVASCGPSRKGSFSLNEVPDALNVRQQFGLINSLTYEDLLKNKKISLEDTPWTDTYWPLDNKETARRWGSIELADHEPNDEVSFTTFFKGFVSEFTKDEPSVLLSPAEKYDLLFQARHNRVVTEEQMAELLEDSAAADAKIAAAATTDDKRGELYAYSEAASKQRLYQSMPLTSNAWNQFLSYSSNKHYTYLGDSSSEGEDWSWTGICHGWAPAAVMSRPPVHGAMALINNKRILFTEGDIRGLLSRSWAQQSPRDKQYFLGRRCNLDVSDPDAPIPSNEHGRGFAGTITINGVSEPFVVTNTFADLKVEIAGSRAVVYNIRSDTTDTELYLVEVLRTGRLYQVPTFSDLVTYLQTSNAGLLSSVEAKFTGCWDVNPASFHEVLVEQLAVRKTGFVMDRTRNGQVWNQPVNAASFVIGPLQHRSAVADIAAEYRAPGTVYVAEVRAVVSWVGEPGSPQLTYKPDFEVNGYVRSSQYEYTLEFDSQKRIIGGEWGSFTKISPEGNAPDFLYGYETGAEPVDNVNSGITAGLIDYSGIVRKLLTCSQSETIDGEQTVGEHSIKYTNCPIEVAQ